MGPVPAQSATMPRSTRSGQPSLFTSAARLTGGAWMLATLFIRSIRAVFSSDESPGTGVDFVPVSVSDPAMRSRLTDLISEPEVGAQASQRTTAGFPSADLPVAANGATAPAPSDSRRQWSVGS